MFLSKLFLLPGMFSLLLGAGCVAPSEPPAASTDTIPAAFTTSSSSSSSTVIITETTSTRMKSQAPLSFPGELSAAQVDGKRIRIKTSMGDIVVELAYDQGPKAASNFLYLVQQGFYDGTIFHRVIPLFMIQGGDPTGTGRGGPGYRFPDDPVKSSYSDGVVAMANAGPHTNGSQFFIMVANVPLPPNYSIFGKVVAGLDVARRIANVTRDAEDRPLEEVKMTSVTVEK